jgi:hypothetical protein
VRPDPNHSHHFPALTEFSIFEKMVDALVWPVHPATTVGKLELPSHLFFQIIQQGIKMIKMFQPLWIRLRERLCLPGGESDDRKLAVPVGNMEPAAETMQP